MIKVNPFTSDTFVSIWTKHYLEGRKIYEFDFAKGISFYRSKLNGLYVNIGKNLTKGISYKPNVVSANDGGGKTFLIYDVPNYFKVPEINHDRIKFYRVTQYPGFLIDLSQYQDFDDYMARSFKKSSRYKLKKYKKKLESCFEISYKMFCGDMPKVEYDSIFKTFNELLTKRFQDKQITNNNLEKLEWDFYREVAYPMILEKKASLFVIFNRDQPIGITLNYFSEEILFDAITVFDIDYSKFHLGSISIMKQVEWSLENKIKTFDFSKGYFDYKKRWANKQYAFQYHIIYDAASLSSKLKAIALKCFFLLKQSLRDKKINEKLHRFTFWLKNMFRKSESNPVPKYEFIELPEGFVKEGFGEISYESPENQLLKKMAFDFLYLNNEHQGNLKVYRKADPESDIFMFCGKGNSVKAKVFQSIAQF